MGQTSSHETVLMAWMFCFPSEGKVFGKFVPLSFINYAYKCTWIRQNLNETVLQLDFHDFHWENKTYKLQRSIRLHKTEPFLCATVDKVYNINRRSSRDNQTYNFQFLLDQEGEVSCNIIMYALKITILDLLGCYENPVRSIGLIFIYVHCK